MRRWRHLLLGTLLWLPMRTSAKSEGLLSLEQAQQEARANAPEVAQLSARLRGTELTAHTAGLVVRHNPTLSGTYMPGSLIPDRSELSWNVGLSQTIDLSGSSASHRRSAEADRERVSYDREDGLRALDEAVAIAMADSARQQRRVDRTVQIVRLQTVAVEAARKELEVGQGNQLDLDATELDLAATRHEAALATAQLGVARAELARLLGRVSGRDLVVEDPPEDATDDDPASVGEPTRNPRIRAAQADIRAAELELETQERLVRPPLTLQVTYETLRANVPRGAFRGPGASGLSAVWGDRDINVGLSIPIPVLNRRKPERAQATSRVLEADAHLRFTEAAVRRDVEVARILFEGAAQALRELVRTPEIVQRQLELLDKALRAGALNAVERATAIRRLQDAGARYDDAVRDLRIARARWNRLATASHGDGGR